MYNLAFHLSTLVYKLVSKLETDQFPPVEVAFYLAMIPVTVLSLNKAISITVKLL